MTSDVADSLELKIAQTAKDLGFDLCKIASVELPQSIGDNLQSYVNLGYHGSMDWMEKTLLRRIHPKKLWPHAQSVIVLAMNYGPASNPIDDLQKKDCGMISVYARNGDYHDIIKGRLKILAGKLISWHECDVKVFVDTAPVMEKPLAMKAGLGWQGKHTNLVSRGFGSWLLLGSIFTTAKLTPDLSESDHCGNCRACLDICPTHAFPAPYRIDARRCISYLTIENKRPIPFKFRKFIGNRIYGCDDCLAVCPWNKFARKASEIKLQPREDLLLPSLDFLMRFDDMTFRKFFSRSPIKRIGRNRFMRNVLIAVGNRGSVSTIDPLIAHIKDPSPLVRGAAIWALRRVSDGDFIAQLREELLPAETDDSVRQEWIYNFDET